MSRASVVRVAKTSERPKIFAYAAPVMGSYFFYVPMWSILPGIYAKYFGLTLTSVAAVVLTVRVFDGVSDLTVGYLSDRRRSAGGSRKPWVIVGGVGTIAACCLLFLPPRPVTAEYYLIASLAYFIAFATAEIPHLTWGSELTLNYQRRAFVYGVRNVLAKTGIAAFYALPLLPVFASHEYTPEVLGVALLVGSIITIAGLAAASWLAPAGIAVATRRTDTMRLLLNSVFRSRPLLLFYAAEACSAISYGAWYGLLYVYLDSYVRIGSKIAIALLIATVVATLTTPWWLKLIRRTSKSTAWATGLALFCLQPLSTLYMSPGDPWWIALGALLLASLCFTANDVAAVAVMGDIIDYGKLKFNADRGATYFAVVNLIWKFGLGLGGGLSLGLAGWFGFRAADALHSGASVWGLKLGFVILPEFFALAALLLVLRTPINSRRHQIIQRRIESRLLRNGCAGPVAA